jgi:hypothetical protein
MKKVDEQPQACELDFCNRGSFDPFFSRLLVITKIFVSDCGFSAIRQPCVETEQNPVLMQDWSSLHRPKPRVCSQFAPLRIGTPPALKKPDVWTKLEFLAYQSQAVGRRTSSGFSPKDPTAKTLPEPPTGAEARPPPKVHSAPEPPSRTKYARHSERNPQTKPPGQDSTGRWKGETTFLPITANWNSLPQLEHYSPRRTER